MPLSLFCGEKRKPELIFIDVFIIRLGSDGSVLWLYPALIKTYCTLDVRYFPFDSQACKIEFISWTHSGDQLDLFYNSSFSNSIYYVPDNQEWVVDSIGAERHVKYYACCVEPYPDVTFTIYMRRGSLFYIVNLIAPCFLIFLISFLGFFLPVESGEKVSLETTILLALVVFLLMVGDMMPPTPDAKDSNTHAAVWIIRLASYFYPMYIPERPDLTTYHHQTDYKNHCYNSDGRRRPADITPSVSDHELDSLAAGCAYCGRGSCRKSAEFGPPHADSELIDVEWRIIARFADRCFFWLFLIISTCMFTLLFLKMIPPERIHSVTNGVT
ncbi:hypothetical protein LSH36_121g01014 [Paralvinella palmiformis]|uniref:Uncharacterized protein n=1 Tax=Paralvinella palmiformis TaxID=53620 RepID=A0AAD9JXH0_9ANNE|nr:hypothetical protein LSH36_121g01014 [Paralvinella palmiformis]